MELLLGKIRRAKQRKLEVCHSNHRLAAQLNKALKKQIAAEIPNWSAAEQKIEITEKPQKEKKSKGIGNCLRILMPMS
ncbi:hypothetical protein XENTR_v10014967 [Xenopus tropicalis]|nr:hypothetical protein XENTR_v10014967 [Xenopus tropicalis]